MLHGRWRQIAGLAICVIAIAALANLGARQARSLYSWPNSAGFVAALKPLISEVNSPVLVQSSTVPEYYLGDSPPWWHWSNTASITLPDGHSLSPGVGVSMADNYAKLIVHGYFGLIALRHNPVI